MATAQRKAILRDIDYPTGDGKPMAETEVHLWVMMDLIQTLSRHFAADPMVYVGGDLLLYYEQGDGHKHLAPDVFVVKGIPKRPPRKNYLMWREGKAPDLVIEVTSESTMENDRGHKLGLYRDVLRVPEYFQFDPTDDYLDPALQGYRLRGGVYRPIRSVGGRLPSTVLGLHLERQGASLRLYDPARGVWLPTPAEESARGRVVAAENAQLRREIEDLRRRATGGG